MVKTDRFCESAVVQFLISPILLRRGILSTILSNTLYIVALSYYHYLNFLGYSALPFLERTEVRVQSFQQHSVLQGHWCISLKCCDGAGVSLANWWCCNHSLVCSTDKLQPNEVYFRHLLFVVGNSLVSRMCRSTICNHVHSLGFVRGRPHQCVCLTGKLYMQFYNCCMSVLQSTRKTSLLAKICTQDSSCRWITWAYIEQDLLKTLPYAFAACQDLYYSRRHVVHVQALTAQWQSLVCLPTTLKVCILSIHPLCGSLLASLLSSL